ncbi:MAG: hypothetical protein O9345_04780 [Burkholderiaceae bacterium]|jgi:ElaB/YqjD/DUF883 family membrane-anchored ribosome-binding protein|nr:DUF883 family protein [Burkholderiales bacterium]MCZ8096825.1 hypothetical protein [Burkholderiales bacterium]MCZ8337457.1 hypothetical protein [Burkholderiaceae bacterium]
MTPQTSVHPSSDRPGDGSSAGASGALGGGTGPTVSDAGLCASGAPGMSSGGHGTDLRGQIERRMSQARRRTRAALEQGAEMSTRAREQLTHGLEVSRDAVAGRPLSSLAIAAVCGLIVGLLMSRRD